MNNRRKLVISLGAGALAAPFHSFAQQPAKVARIGWLEASSPSVIAARTRDRGTLVRPDIAAVA